MFLLNSRLGLVSATPQGLKSESAHPMGRPFSRSYGANLPSSLARVIPRALGFSPCPPVAVYGTGTPVLLRGFSGQHGSGHFATSSFAGHHASGTSAGFAWRTTLHAWTGTTNGPLYLPSCVTPSVFSEPWWYRNLHRLSIAYAFRPRLRSRLTLSGRAFLRNP